MGLFGANRPHAVVHVRVLFHSRHCLARRLEQRLVRRFAELLLLGLDRCRHG